MSLFRVTLCASDENATMPSYAQCLTVHDQETDKYLGEWRGVNKFGECPYDYPFEVVTEEVWAKCVFSAMRRFREWQTNGKDRDWLMKGDTAP